MIEPIEADVNILHSERASTIVLAGLRDAHLAKADALHNLTVIVGCSTIQISTSDHQRE